MTGSSLYVVETPGDAPPVVFVHGAMDRSSAFGRVRNHLGGRRSITYDRRGYGRSRDLGPGTIETHVADLWQIISDRAGGIPVVVAGHSLGGTLGLALAQRGPELVASVLAYEPPVPWMPMWPSATAGGEAAEGGDDPEAAAERFMRRMVGDRRWERLPEQTRQDRRAEGPALVAELASSRSAPAFDPVAIRVPVVLAHGDQSARHHLESVPALAAMIDGAELAVIEGAGHGAHLTHPAAFAALVVRAIDRAEHRQPARGTEL